MCLCTQHPHCQIAAAILTVVNACVWSCESSRCDSAGLQQLLYSASSRASSVLTGPLLLVLLCCFAACVAQGHQRGSNSVLGSRWALKVGPDSQVHSHNHVAFAGLSKRRVWRLTGGLHSILSMQFCCLSRQGVEGGGNMHDPLQVAPVLLSVQGC